MSPLRAFLALILAAPAAFAVVGPDDVYQESNGILVMEAERTSSSLGTGTDRWETHTPGETNYVDGAANEAHIEFQGNGSNGGTPKTPLTYNFKINQGGFYYLHLRARARLDGAEPDKNNDCYVKVGGDSFGAGPNAGNTHMNDAPLSLLTNDTKMYGGSPTTWGWANLLDAGGTTNKRYPVYNFTSGGEYTLTISGRSIKFNIDRIVFRRSTVDEIAAKADTVAESATTPTSGATSANAGSDKSLILPTSSVVLNGSGSASTGSITSYAWSQVSGPSTAALSGAATVNLTASALVQGAYVFRLTVTTSEGQTATDDTIVNVAASGGSGQSVATLMLVNADTDNDIGPMTSGMTIDLAVTGANLNIRADTSPATVGSVRFSYDAVSNYMTQSGAPYTIGGDTLTDYWAWTPALGTHTLTATPYTLSAGGGTAGTPLTVVFTVINSQVTGNPVANAGTDQSITLPTSSVVLTGSGTDNGGSISSYAWSQVSGPSTATLSGAASANLTASALVQGSYIFRLTVTDNSGLTATDDTTVTVAAAPGSNPIVSAGSDQTIIRPASTATLTGSASDPGGSISSHAWIQLTGPSTATLSGAATPVLGLSGLIEGTYTFRLTVTDNSGNIASDEAAVSVLPATSGPAIVSGELKKWHKVTLSFTGPATSESATPNPFTDYRLNVTFTHPATGKSYIIPGYYAADGNAANTSATSGNVWRVHFAPDETGAWTYLASFRSGTNIATDTAAGPSAGFFDASAGNFSIAATDKSGTDFRGKGRLDYVGKHHLRFAETGEYFMKAGVDAPENLLAYQDFDGDFKTDGQGDTYIKVWTAHVADWQTGDPVWQGTKGKGLIGAINYLASEGLNAFSFLTMNINGDDKNVFPYSSYGERVRLDVSKLDQWEMVFEHGTKKGMHLHFKTQEIENQNLLDGGDLGNQRKLYYRELMARFGHHPALNWNLGEECTATTTRKKSWAQYFHDNDPYKHPIVIHNTTSVLHKELLGSASKLTGFSLQLNASDFTDMFTMTKDYIDDSAATGRPWVVACDEPGDSQYSLRPDSDSGAATSHTNARKNAIWGNIMAGGAGCEYYFGYALAHSDLTCQDFRSRNAFWDYCRYALQFLDANDVPFQEMSNQNSLVSGNGNNANRCLAKTGQSYLVQLHSGGTHTLNLSGASGQFTVKWLNPRTGATVTRPNITGGGSVSLGSPPDTTTQDWIVFVQTSSASPTNTAPLVNAGPDKSAILSAASVQVALTGTVTDDGLPDALALSRNWSFVSGPAAVTFSPANTAATTASFTALGTYLLRLTSSDTQFTASDDVQVTISAPAVGGNAPPVFSGFSTSIAANQSVFISHTLILNGSSDPDGDPVSLVVGDGTSTGGGSVTMSDGLLVYTPVTGFNGADSFPLTVQDGRGGFSTAPLLIQVGPLVSDGITGNPPPVVEKLAGNQMRIRYTGNPGLSYAFQRSTNLVNWTTLQTLTSGANGTVEYTDPNPPAGKAFYRIATP
jgi:hypothetical protein